MSEIDIMIQSTYIVTYIMKEIDIYISYMFHVCKPL